MGEMGSPHMGNHGCWGYIFCFFLKRYEATLKKRNVVDYDDMLLLCAQVLPFGHETTPVDRTPLDHPSLSHPIRPLQSIAPH